VGDAKTESKNTQITFYVSRFERIEQMEKSEKIALFAVVTHIVLLAIKYTFALLSGSIALKAEAIHSLSDIVASLTVFAGLKISKRKSKSFPYGLYKVENLVSILVALAIFFAGYEIVTEALSSSSSADLNHVPLTIASVLCIIGITFGFSRILVLISLPNRNQHKLRSASWQTD